MDAVDVVFIRNRLTDTRGLVRVVALVKQGLGWIAACVQILLSLIVFFAFFLGLLRLGLFMAAGLSLWRLIHHDYGNTGGDPSKSNMNPALSVLYILVVVQSATLAYKQIILGPVWRRIVDRVAKIYGFTGHKQAVESVSDYYKYILRGCSKDTTFAKGSNLITYAVDLLGPNMSHEKHQSGTRILGTLLGHYSLTKPERFDGQRKLIKQLLTSSSSSHILQKLLQMLDTRRRPYDREIRDCAARIVAFVADEIRLEQFPRELQSISSLIESFEDWYARDLYQQGLRQASDSVSDLVDIMKDYIILLTHGMSILYGLASDENNCRVISTTQGLLSKIMAPVTCDLARRINFETWIPIVEMSLMVMSRLVAAPGETGVKLREKISRNTDAIYSMQRIISCESFKRQDGLHLVVMDILTRLYSMDTEGSQIIFINMLVRIFTGENEDSSSREMAGEALAKLSLNSQRTVWFILKAEDDVVDHLSKILLDVQLPNKEYRISAAEILENLCSQYTSDDECLSKLKIAMTDAMPKVLKEICLCGLEGDETHTPTEPQLSDHGQLQEADIENQRDNQQDNYQGNITSSSDPQNNEQGEDKYWDEEFNATLFSLCVTVCDIFISPDQDLAHQFCAITPGNGASSFPQKLKDMVEKMRHPRPTCVRTLKLTSMMLISMMEHRGSYLKQDLESLMESLYTGSKYMSILDGSPIFANGEGGAIATKAIRRSLASLLEEAEQLVDKYEPQEI